MTWGVLDRLLEEDWLTINAVSGTSAGAMNGAALASGLATGGREGAREKLEEFWRNVSAYGAPGGGVHSAMDMLFGPLNPRRTVVRPLIQAGLQVLSPYDVNPLGFNPLSKIIQDTLDLEAIATSPVRLFVTATHVSTGEARIFSNPEITVDSLLATACLPSLFHAVEIDGELYWDGGYAGNPSLMPLVRGTGATDIILVQLNPTESPQAPRSAQQIAEREKEIAFNAPLIKELRLVAELQRQAGAISDVGHASPGGGRKRFKLLPSKTGAPSIVSLRFHRILPDAMTDAGSSSKLTVDWKFLSGLRDKGRQTASEFLSQHGDDIGRSGSLDLSQWLHPAPSDPVLKAAIGK